jgi:SAM-dependent methyltransferase
MRSTETLTDPDGAAAYYGEQSLSAAFHDLLAHYDPAIRGDIAFYAEALARGAHVLELGCGSGRVAIALAARGFRVTGLDLAPAMLRLANANRKRQPSTHAARVRFASGDMTGVDLERRFDAVVVPFYGFNHLSGAPQRQQTLEVIARHLGPRGRAYIHVLPPVQLSAILDMEGQPGWTIAFNGASRELRCRPLTRHVDPNTRRMVQTVEYTVVAIDGGLMRRTEEFYAYHWFDDEEMDTAAAAAGLAVSARTADFGEAGDGGPKTMYVLEHSPD